MAKERAKKPELNSQFSFTEALLLGGIAPVLILVSLGGVPSSARAQEKAEEAKKDTIKYELPAVEVWGERYLQQNKLTSTVTVVGTEEQLKNQRPSAAYDALRMEPGLHMSRVQGASGSGKTRIMVRGLGSTPVAGIQVLTDGRPDITVTFEHPIPEFHTLEVAQRIEVIHGPSPVLYGYGNTGVVNIITTEPGPGVTGALQASGGTFGTGEVMARASYGSEKGYLRVSAKRLVTDGHIANTAFRSYDVNAKASYKFDETWKISIAGGTGQSFARIPLPFDAPSDISFDYTLPSGDVTLVGLFKDVSASLKLWVTSLDFMREQVAEGRRTSHAVERGAKLRANLTMVPQTLIRVGADIHYAEASNTPAGGVTSTGNVTDVGPYLFVERSLGNITLNVGLRATLQREFGSEFSPDLGLIVEPVPETSLRARVTRGFRPPTVRELYGVFGGNPNSKLNPERLWQYELGINRSIDRYLNLDLVAFLQEGSNLITSVVSPPGRFENIGNFTHRGIEGKISYRISDDIRLRAGVTFLDVGNNFDRGVPENAYDLGLTLTHGIVRPGDLAVTVGSRYVTNYFALAGSPATKTPLLDFFVADAKVSYEVWKNQRAFIAVDNITDRDYQTFVGIRMPGRTINVGVSSSIE